MDQLTSYQDDVYAWSREQASVLRELRNRHDLPNALDLENVAEEIESVGSEVRNAVQSFIRLILLHLIKVAVSPAEETKSHWEEEIAGFHVELIGRYTRSMRKDLDLDLVWRRAVRQAEVHLRRYGESLPSGLARDCPVPFELFLAEAFDADAALNVVRAACNVDTARPSAN